MSVRVCVVNALVKLMNKQNLVCHQMWRTILHSTMLYCYIHYPGWLVQSIML